MNAVDKKGMEMFKKDGPIRVSRDNLRRARFHGPLVTLSFVKPPRAHLKRVRFFIAPEHRVTFLTQFDRLFPGFLPEEYQTALRREQSRIREPEESDSMSPES